MSLVKFTVPKFRALMRECCGFLNLQEAVSYAWPQGCLLTGRLAIAVSCRCVCVCVCLSFPIKVSTEVQSLTPGNR